MKCAQAKRRKRLSVELRTGSAAGGDGSHIIKKDYKECPKHVDHLAFSPPKSPCMRSPPYVRLRQENRIGHVQKPGQWHWHLGIELEHNLTGKAISLPASRDPGATDILT